MKSAFLFVGTFLCLALSEVSACGGAVPSEKICGSTTHVDKSVSISIEEEKFTITRPICPQVCDPCAGYGYGYGGYGYPGWGYGGYDGYGYGGLGYPGYGYGGYGLGGYGGYGGLGGYGLYGGWGGWGGYGGCGRRYCGGCDDWW